eukprot:6178550-Amphidinium_carterae.1
MTTSGASRRSVSSSQRHCMYRTCLGHVQARFGPGRQGIETLQNCNYNASGFNIFGEFAQAAVTGAIMSPGQVPTPEKKQQRSDAVCAFETKV